MQTYTLYLLLLGFLLIIIGVLLRRKNKQKYRILLPIGIVLAVILAAVAWFMPAYIFDDVADDEISITLYSEATGLYDLNEPQKEEFLTALCTTKFRREFFESKELSGDEVYYLAIMFDGHQHYNLNLYVSIDGSPQLLQIDTQKFWLRQVYRSTNPDLLSQCIIRIIHNLKS